MTHVYARRLLLSMLILAVGFGCGGDDDGGGGGGAADAAAAAGEPCDFQNPISVVVGETVIRDQPTTTGDCQSGTHFYRFTPEVTGVYTITKSGGGTLGFCDSEDTDGCICGVNSNCCSECTLTFGLPSGDPLPASSNNQIYLVPNMTTTGAYTFTVTGPN